MKTTGIRGFVLLWLGQTASFPGGAMTLVLCCAVQTVRNAKILPPDAREIS